MRFYAAMKNVTSPETSATGHARRAIAVSRIDRAAVDALEQRRMLSGTPGPMPALEANGTVDLWVPSQTGNFNNMLVEGEFRIYSAMRSVDTSAQDAAGLRPINVSYSDLYVIRADGTLDRDQLDEDRVRARAREASDAGVPWVIDIEHWAIDIRLNSQSEVQATLDKFIQLIDWAKDERPDIQIGFYGILPLRNYWGPVEQVVLEARARSEPGFENRFPERFVAAQERIDDWKRANDFLQPLADAVDFIVPSLYTFYDDPVNWVVYAEANMAEAAQWGKPVVPFLWPQYHDSGVLAGQMVDADFWQLQLDTVRAHADSVIIWGAAAMPIAGEAWWQPTIDFVNENRDVDTRSPERPTPDRDILPVARSTDAIPQRPVIRATATTHRSMFASSEPLIAINASSLAETLTTFRGESESERGESRTQTLANRLLAFAKSNPSLFEDAFNSGRAQDLLDSLKSDR